MIVDSESNNFLYDFDFEAGHFKLIKYYNILALNVNIKFKLFM